jgi:hypothetical protein
MPPRAKAWLNVESPSGFIATPPPNPLRGVLNRRAEHRPRGRTAARTVARRWWPVAAAHAAAYLFDTPSQGDNVWLQLHRATEKTNRITIGPGTPAPVYSPEMASAVDRPPSDGTEQPEDNPDD